MGGLVALSLKVLNQSSQVLVFGDDQSKLLRVFEREVDMPRSAVGEGGGLRAVPPPALLAYAGATLPTLPRKIQ